MDKKPVEPAPILQLVFTDPNDEVRSSTDKIPPQYIAHAALYDAEGVNEIIHEGKASLNGTVTSALFRLRDENGDKGAFFVFHDLYVRLEGRYSISFTIFEIVGFDLKKNASTPRCGSAFSANIFISLSVCFTKNNSN